ncbi:MAG: FtsW/RodA/SpoVE family cell cycle protein [Chloroflexi bacterium]|nr:FtsW/RodA/SpoVE family cell cycle protein [Chloroflexota bacterium]
MITRTLRLHWDSSDSLPRARTERLLLLLGGAFMVVNLWALALVRGEPLQTHLTAFVVWVGCALVGTFALQRWLPRRDPLLFPITMFLCGWGLVMIDRLAPIFAARQTLWLAVSVAGLLATALFPYGLRWLKNYRYLLLVGGLVLLVSTIIFGTNPSGQPGTPRLWLNVGAVFFQPSEALKIILVAFLASYLAEQYPALRAAGLNTASSRLWLSPRIYGPVLLMWGLCVVVLIWQRDLGTAILFFIVFIALLYIASGYTLILLGGAALVLLASVVAYNLFDVVQLRVDIWLNPWPEADGRAFQIVQSLLAFAAGGVFGQGVGQGAPGYIPVVHSDFMFAAVAEEFGQLGVLVVVVSLVMLIARGLRTAIRQQRRPFYALLAVGLSLLIATQSLLIMGGALKLLPLTGVTLPFLSYGGSSLLMSFIMIGLLLRLSAEE